jgi:uncharacterized BrkB/YihY/UPF0761 family membrane protein
MVTTATPRSAVDDLDEQEDDWPSQAADAIERAVGSVRDKTTGPLLKLAKGVVYGTFAALVGVTALVIAVIGAIHALDNYLPDSVFGERHMWAVHLIVGLVFVVSGGILWSRRRASEQTSAH